MKNKKSLLIVLLLMFGMVLVACGGGAAEPAAEEAAPVEEAPAEEAAPAEEEAAPAEEEAMEEPSGEKQTLKVWSFTPEMGMPSLAFEERYPDVDVEFTSIPMTAGEYQTKLLSSLGTADAPDVVALEAAFVKEYVESDFLADVSDLKSKADELSVFPFVTDVGTDPDGVVRAYSWQATPGALFYRRSLAQEYFGTDDPEELQALMSDMDKYAEAAAVVKEMSGGDTYMVASNGDFAMPFYANREQPWVVDGKLTLDPMAEKYVETAKLFRDEGYEAQATQWQEGWFAGMNDTLVDAEGNPKQIFSYFLPTWGLPYVLAPNAAAADGSTDTSGDWGVIPGPLPYSWGGTWVAALDSSENLDLAKQFVEFSTLDEEHLTKWATGVYTNEYFKAIDPSVPDDMSQAAGDFLASQVVVEKIVDSFDDSEMSAFLAGQNSYAGFAEAAPLISAEILTGSDDAIQRALQDPMNQYLSGEISLEDMWATWKSNIAIEFPDLIIE